MYMECYPKGCPEHVNRQTKRIDILASKSVRATSERRSTTTLTR